MFGLKNVFSDAVAKKTSLDKDAVAQLLKTNPKALQAFEAAYAAQALDEESDNFFEQNSRQASAALRESQTVGSGTDMAVAKNLISRIVDELLAKTSVYEFNGDLSVPAKVELPKALPDGTLSVTCGIAITWTVRKDDAVIHIKEIEQSCLAWSLAGIGKILPVDQRIDET